MGPALSGGAAVVGQVGVLYRSGTAGNRGVVRGGQEAAQTAAPMGTTLGPADLGIAHPCLQSTFSSRWSLPTSTRGEQDTHNYYSHVTDELLREWNRQHKTSLTQVRVPPLPLSVLRQVAKLLLALSIRDNASTSPKGLWGGLNEIPYVRSPLHAWPLADALLFPY